MCLHVYTEVVKIWDPSGERKERRAFREEFRSSTKREDFEEKYAWKLERPRN
jgi:hypothetical protein